MLRPFFAFVVVVTSLTGLGGAQDGFWIDRAVAAPSPCGGSLLAFDHARGESVWFGSQTCGETWVWNGATWQQRASMPVQPPGFGPGAYDSARQVVVAVLGNHSTGLQTWEWNGSVWAQRGTGPQPARHSFGLAYDAARGVTVLFGGNSGNESNSYADTWTWNGTVWTQVMLGGPTPRSAAGMAFDAQRQTVVLFGGRGQFGGQPAFFGDTWEWNGSQWVAHFGVVGPSPRRAGLVYDSLRNRTLLPGGSDGQSLLTDLWEWNGSAWSQLQPQTVPPGGVASIVHDDVRGVMVAIQGATWEYLPGSAVPATFATYGAGCAGPTGVPQLSNVVGSLPRIGSTLQMQLTNLPASLFNVPLGFLGFDASTWNGMPLPLSLTPLGFTGCDVLLAPVRTDGLQNVGGIADWNVPLPVNAHALGADVYFQAAVLVPGWNPAGFVFSNGGHAVVGSP